MYKPFIYFWASFIFAGRVHFVNHYMRRCDEKDESSEWIKIRERGRLVREDTSRCVSVSDLARRLRNAQRVGDPSWSFYTFLCSSRCRVDGRGCRASMHVRVRKVGDVRRRVTLSSDVRRATSPTSTSCGAHRENDVPLHLRARAVNRCERLMQVNELSALPMLSLAAFNHSNRLSSVANYVFGPSNERTRSFRMRWRNDNSPLQLRFGNLAYCFISWISYLMFCNTIIIKVLSGRHIFAPFHQFKRFLIRDNLFL